MPKFALTVGSEVRIEEAQGCVPDVRVQFDPVHAGRIIAGFGKVIPPDLVALIVEDLVADRTGQYIQLRMRDVFRREGGISLGWGGRVTGSAGVLGGDATFPTP